MGSSNTITPITIKPYQKLIGQVIGAAIVVNYGLVLPWTRSLPANMVITIFWLIGITNAINLLDNMDGLATGIAAIASGFLTFNFMTANQTTEALMLGGFHGGVGRISDLQLESGLDLHGRQRIDVHRILSGELGADKSRRADDRAAFVPVLAVPILVLFIPIFDTTFVTILRKLSGRAASQGGRDHTSHRLVALGLSEKRAVLMLYGLAALSGLLAVMVRQLKPDVSLALLAIFTLGLTLLGVYLAGVKGYDEEEEVRAARDNLLFAFLIDFSYKRRIFEVLLDVILIVLAYWSAYAIKFEPFSNSPAWKLILAHPAGVGRGETGRLPRVRRLSRHLAIYEHGRFAGLRQSRRRRLDRQHDNRAVQVSLPGFFARGVFDRRAGDVAAPGWQPGRLSFLPPGVAVRIRPVMASAC